MKTARILQQTLRTLAVASVGILWATTAAQADTLTFTNSSPRSAAAEMSRRYGVTIVFKSIVNAGTPVTFSVDNPDTPEGRLQAISNLANATGMDFQKVYVVSKVSAGTTIPEVKIDSDGPIVFTSTTLPARDAIQTVAAVDNALVQISDAVSGDVTLPDTHLNAMAAAAVIAKQTGTVWKAYYGLYRRGETPPRFAGTVLDRTADGQPILQLPLLTYRNPTSHTVPLNSGANAVVGPIAPLSNGPDVLTVQDTSLSVYPDLGFGPYGYNPYGNGYNPYANGGFGYLAPDGSVAAPGMVYTPGAGATPVVPGVNAPGVNAATGPNGTTVLLPNSSSTSTPTGQ